MIIDSHVHLVKLKGKESIHTLINSANKNNIDMIMASCLGKEKYIKDPTVEMVVEFNEYTRKAMDEFTNKINGLCYICPMHGEKALEEIDKHIAHGPMVGIKLWQNVKASDSKVEPIAKKAIELDIPILQHAWYNTLGNSKNESTALDVVVLAQKFPELRIHMAHLYGIRYRGIVEIEPHHNISVDTCGGEPESAILEYALRKLGPERILFGSDAPGRSFAIQLGKVLGTPMSEEAREMILWKNVKELYKL